MAARNPTWARDELIVALDLYFEIGVQSATHPKVVEVSRVLNRLPIHSARPDAERFRNPNGVNLKLANFGALDPDYGGTGMQRGGAGDAAVFDEFRSDRDRLRRVAAAIRAMALDGSAPSSPEDDEDDVAAAEGRLLYRQHRLRERDRKLVAKKKAGVLRDTGRLACEACDIDFGERYGPIAEGFIECHHTLPLAEGAERVTRTSDLAVLCPNCHRVAHRHSPPLGVAELRDLLIADRPVESPTGP